MGRYGFFSSVYKKSSIDTLFDEIKFYSCKYSAIRYARSKGYRALFYYIGKEGWEEIWRIDELPKEVES